MLAEFLDLDEKIFSQEFWDEISVFTRIVIPVSGGIDSTVVFLEFTRQGINFELVWNNTLRSMRTARITLSRYIFNQGYPFTILYPLHEQKFISKKTREVMAKIVSGQQQFRKKSIPCCYYLKEAPMTKWLKKHTNEETLIVSGLASYESMQRNIHLGVLRKKSTYIRFLKVQRRWFAYPLRDFNHKSDRLMFKAYLHLHKIKAMRSGCVTCPIVALFDEAMIKQGEDPGRVRISKKVWLVK